MTSIPSGSSGKRSANESVECNKRQAARRDNECARCGRLHELDVFCVHSASGVGRAVLCRHCAGDASTELAVLDAIDEEDGLPLVVVVAAAGDSKLGSFGGHAGGGGERRCAVCASRSLLVACHPLHWGSERANTGIKIHLCDRCRVCDECGEAANAGDGIDVTVDGERTLCERCAMWCNWCEAFFFGGCSGDEEIGDHFQQAAFDGDGRPLCKRQCAYCQEDDAVVAHPRSDRRYCHRCVLANNWVDEQMHGDFGSDEKGWHKMKPAV